MTIKRVIKLIILKKCYRRYQCPSSKVIEVINIGKLFFLADYAPPKDIPNAFYFNIDQVLHVNIKDLVYQPFYEDFGPLNIAKVWKYINEIHKILTNPLYSKNVFYHQTSLNYKKCCNSILLICAYQVSSFIITGGYDEETRIIGIQTLPASGSETFQRCELWELFLQMHSTFYIMEDYRLSDGFVVCYEVRVVLFQEI